MFGLAAQAHVLVIVVPPAPEAQCLGETSGVGAPLSTCPFGDTISSSPGHYKEVVATKSLITR
jgi:hypothetical protein